MARRAARQDDNHDEIRTAFRSFGAVVIDTFQLPNTFDMLVAFRGKLYPVEVKDGSKPPSRRKLTEGEQQCKQALEFAGVKYNVVESVDDAAKMLGLK